MAMHIYRRKQEKLRRKMEKKEKKEKKGRKQIAVQSKSGSGSPSKSNSVPLSAQKSTASSTVSLDEDTPDGHMRQKSYFERRRHSRLSHAQSKLQEDLKKIVSTCSDSEADSDSDSDEAAQCDNLLQMAVDTHSKTMDYLNDLGFLSLFAAVVLSHTQALCVLCFFVTLFLNATILSSVVPIVLLIGGLLQFPRADQQFWLWMAAYVQVTMVLKFLYQLDIFCVAGYPEGNAQSNKFFYNVQSSFYCNSLNSGIIRWDQILGITKSEMSNDAISVLFADIVCLIFVNIHIMMLKKKGVWSETEASYDNYIEIWFQQYEKRQVVFKHLEAKQGKKGKHKNKNKYHEHLKHCKTAKHPMVGEPLRVYDAEKDEFVEDEVYPWYVIGEYSKKYVGLNSWDTVMLKAHDVFSKLLPLRMRMSFFEVIPPSFRLFNDKHWHSISEEVKPGTDLYFWMFVLDLVLLVWCLLFYTLMAEPRSSQSATSGFASSRFSGGMVGILSVQILFMIADRIVYLTNTLILKVLCQWVSVIWFHWLIFVVWAPATNIAFYDNGYLMWYYLLRVVYWLLSCKQIRYGYPTFSRQHSRMSRQFNFVYWIWYTVYMAIPFVYEMRTLLEWVCIPTTLQLIELMKVEDIYGQVFRIKCSNTEYAKVRQRGDQQPMIKKFFQGGCVFIAIVGFLIVPLLLFSTASPASTANAVESSALSVTITAIQGFGDMPLLSLTNYQLKDFPTVPMELRQFYDPTSQFSQEITYESDADSIFTVPEVLRERVSDILGCVNISSDAECELQLLGTQITMSYDFTRKGPDDNNPISGTMVLNAQTLNRSQAYSLSQVLNASNQNITSFVCPTNYSEWLRLQAQGKVQSYSLTDNPQHAVTLTLKTDDEVESYWNIISGSDPDASDDGIHFVLISDNFVSSSLLSIAGGSYSVIGFYVVVVWGFAQLLRLMFGDQVKEIIFQDLQNVDYILRIVTAVKLARNQRNYHLEELLYRKLIRIYRDPSLIVALTKRLKESETKDLAMDGIKDTSSNDPMGHEWGMRNRKESLMKQRRAKSGGGDDGGDSVPPIQSNLT